MHESRCREAGGIASHLKIDPIPHTLDLPDVILHIKLSFCLLELLPKQKIIFALYIKVILAHALAKVCLVLFKLIYSKSNILLNLETGN